MVTLAKGMFRIQITMTVNNMVYKTFRIGHEQEITNKVR